MDHKDISRLVQESLTPDLLSPQWRKRVKDTDHPTRGHCYVAAEAAYHLLGGRAAKWHAYVATYEGKDGQRETHWWLQKGAGTLTCDPTAAQFKESEPYYHLGVRKGFLTKQPSKRAQEVIQRVRDLVGA